MVILSEREMYLIFLFGYVKISKPKGFLELMAPKKTKKPILFWLVLQTAAAMG